MNGTSIGSATVSGSYYNNTVDNLVIGGQLSGTNYDNKIVQGFLSNVRLIIGDGIYTGAFTPPTNELTVTANTKLLCCQSPIDKTLLSVASGFSINNHSGTAGAYAPSGLTGGIDFPGSQGAGLNSNGMRLINGRTDFAGDYTIEFWFNIDSTASLSVDFELYTGIIIDISNIT